MSKDYEGQDPLTLAHQAEKDLNSHQAKTGLPTSGKAGDSRNESGIDDSATSKYPGATVTTGPQSSGRQIPPEEGGDIEQTGRVMKGSDFEGEGGPETKRQIYKEKNPGNDDVEGNVRQQGKPEGTTVPTKFGGGIVGKEM